MGRDKLGRGFEPATLDELAELARARATALGRPVVVAAFTGSDRCTVVDLDLDDDEQLHEVHTTPGVLLEHPSVGRRARRRLTAAAAATRLPVLALRA